MHHLAVKRSNLVDAAHTGPEASQLYRTLPLCPKPRRVGSSSVPEFFKSLGCSNHSQLNSDGRNGVHNIMIISDNADRWSQACYSGSPSGRVSNPMVHDVQTHQMGQYSPFSRLPMLPENNGVAAAFD